ncbi:hypothetical protein HY839_04265 [Candidatus Azambacteria bacterium]|nr:hypothetical protein [Candidatus Azambacteria bacterium]
MKKYFSLSKLAIGFFIFLSFWSITTLTADPDLWWHVKVGEWIIEHNAVPHYDIYSHTMQGFEWFDHEWLIEAALWLLYGKDLWWLAVLIFSLLSFLPFLFWLRRARSFAHVWIITLIAFAMTHTIGVRAQVFSFALFFIVFEIVRKRYGEEARGAVSRASFFALPFIFFAWANLHAGFFSGLVLFGIFIFIRHFVAWWKARQIAYRALVPDLLVFAASFAATFINPYGWKVYQLIFEALLSPETARYIVEWRPVFSTNRPHVILLVGLFAFIVARYRKKYPPALLAAGAAFFVLFIKSVKMGPLFFITAIPIFAHGEEYIKEEISRVRRDHPFSAKTKEMARAGAVLLFFVLFFFFGSYMRPYAFSLSRDAVFSLPRSSYFPEKAVAVLREEAARGDIGNIFNAYGWGGYLIFYAPEIKVFVDGRMPQWVDERGGSAMRDYVKVYYGGIAKEQKEVLQRRNIETVFIENSKRKEKGLWARRLARLLSDPEKKSLPATLVDEGWSVVYEDEGAIILRCPDGSCWK